VCIIVNTVSRWIIKLYRQYDFFLGQANMYVCICGYYCKYYNELRYNSPVNGMIAMSKRGHYKYCNELCYKTPWAICFVFSSLASYRCH